MQLIIPNSEEGDFYCEVTNELYPDLILETEVISIENSRPTVSISSLEKNPTNSNMFTLQINFSEEIEGFELSDLVVSNGVARNLLTSNNINFTVDITPVSDGIVTVDIDEAVVMDLAKNSNESADQFSID